MAVSDLQAQRDIFVRLASHHERLLELDRAGWAWEWLCRNPDFASLKLATETRNAASRPVVIRPEAASECSLLRWGLHYG